MAKEYKFHVIDANQSVKEINSDIREHLQKILE